MKQPSIRRQRRIDGAVARQPERDKRSPEKQLHILDQRLGENEGADKERRRLMWQMTQEV